MVLVFCLDWCGTEEVLLLVIDNVITIFYFYIADVVAVTEAEAGGLGRSGAGDISTEVRSFRSNRTLIR